MNQMLAAAVVVTRKFGPRVALDEVDLEVPAGRWSVPEPHPHPGAAPAPAGVGSG